MRLNYLKTIIFLSSIFLTQNIFAQKYIKYFFLENKVRIIVEKSITETKDTSIINNTFKKENIIKAFIRKSGDVQFVIYQKNSELISFDHHNDRMWVEFSEKYQNPKLLERKVIKVNNKDLSFIEFSTGSEYFLIYDSFIDKQTYLRFEFKAPLGQMKKWQPIAYDMMKSLDIKL